MKTVAVQSASRVSWLTGRRVFIVCTMLLGVALLACFPGSATAQDESSYLYVTEWQIPHVQGAIWEAFEGSNYKPAFEKLMSDHSISSWGFYTHTIHTPDGPTHGLWFSAESMTGIDATLNAIASFPVNSVLNNPQVKQRDFLFRTLASAGRGATGANGILWVHRTLSAPGRRDPNPAVWDKYLKPTLDSLVAQGTILSYGIETERIHTTPDGAFYIYCLLPGAKAADKFFAALDAVQSKMTAAERNDFNAAQLPGEQERLGHVSFFSLADPPTQK